MAAQPQPSLRDACVLALSKQLHATPRATFSAVAWNEDVLLALLRCTLQLGRLNTHSLALFQDVAPDNPRLEAQLRALNIQPLPVMAASSGRAWLGQKPHLF